MNLSRPFIYRPVATSLLALGVILAGFVGFILLPITRLPEVDYPTISISASQPGASPENMAATVATPLERALTQIAGITEMTSRSSLGSTGIQVQFELNRDINGAAREVQAAINASLPLLPTGLTSRPRYRKANISDSPIIIFSMTSDTLTMGQLYDVADTVLAQRLSQVEGVGQVNVGGSSKPAVRVELNPSVLDKYGISVETVRQAIVSANANRPKGFVSEGDRSWMIGADDQSRTATEYRPLIVAYRNGAAVRLGNVAEVSDSVQDVHNSGYINGKPAILLLIYRQPGSNILEMVDRIRALIPQLTASIPSDVELKLVTDRSPSIRDALKEVERTLIISMFLVVFVVFVFLRNVRATLIPAVAVPVSLIGTFGFMYLCGFSLNLLSLMALTVATGFVVDDAIVVLENVSRHIENGMKPFPAALRGAREVGFTVLSMSLSLIAVFLPVLLMGGIVGRLLREFAVTLSVSILISLVVSLTLTPMMCARMLRKKDEAAAEGETSAESSTVVAAESAVPAGEPAIAAPATSVSRPELRHRTLFGKLRRFGKTFYDRMLNGYLKSLSWALRHSPLTIVILLAAIALNVYLYTIVPKGLFPRQDTGRLVGGVQADQSISFAALQTAVTQLMEVVKADPDVLDVMGFQGSGGAMMFVTLKPLGLRKATADVIIARIRKKTSKIIGATLYLNAAQDIRIGGRQSNAEYQYTLLSDDVNDLRIWEPKIRDALSKLDEIVNVNTDSNEKSMQSFLRLDRDDAARFGITPRIIDATLNDFYGQRQISTIYNAQNQYKVVMEAAPQYSQSPEVLKTVRFPTSGNLSVPLSAVARIESNTAARAVNHQGQFVAATISFNLSEGVSLSQATDAINNAMSRVGVPGSIYGTFAGTTSVFQDSIKSQPILIAVALLTIYIVLGVLYESLIHPLTILSTLPSAGVGALLALLITGQQFTIIAFIAVILLVGIVKKNAIMMIDFAIHAERDLGLDSRDAIFEACRLRFRPIMMTTMAALFGALPLALATGEGVEMRAPLGIAIVGGLILSQLLTLYTTPVVYLYLDRLNLWVGRTAASMRGRGKKRAAVAAGHP